MMAGSCLKILRICAVIYLKDLAKGSKQHPYMSLTLQAPLDLLGDLAQVTEQLAQQPEPVAELSLIVGPHSKPAVFLVTQHMDQSNTPKCGIQCLKNPQRSTRHCAFSWSQKGQHATIYSSPYKGYLDMPHTTGPLETSLSSERDNFVLESFSGRRWLWSQI